MLALYMGYNWVKLVYLYLVQPPLNIFSGSATGGEHRRRRRGRRGSPCASAVTVGPVDRECPSSSAPPGRRGRASFVLYLLPVDGEPFKSYFRCPSCAVHFRYTIQCLALLHVLCISGAAHADPTIALCSLPAVCKVKMLTVPFVYADWTI
jgi:hypothetical protein